MECNRDLALRWILQAEGGFTHDTGGDTRWGISQKSYPTLDIENLTWEDAKEIYAQDYWINIDANNMESGIDLILFDCAVNQGVPYAKHLRRMYIIRRMYINVNDTENEMIIMIILLFHRLMKYTVLGRDDTYKPYLRGWCNRILNLVGFLKTELNIDLIGWGL